jgi:hypothetical protein
MTVLAKNSRRFGVAVPVSLSLMRLSSVLVMEHSHEEEKKMMSRQSTTPGTTQTSIFQQPVCREPPLRVRGSPESIRGSLTTDS